MICAFSGPACPHCRARNGFPSDQRRKWDALVRAFQTMPLTATAGELAARADGILDRAHRLQEERLAAQE